MKLGDLVRDRITAFEGVAVCECVFPNMVTRVSVQPRDLKDGQPQKTVVFDVTDLILRKPSVVKLTKIAKTTLKLGDAVKDGPTGLEGTLTARLEYLNGCRRWEITQSKLNYKNHIVQHVLDEGRLEKIAAALKPAKAAGKNGGDMPDISAWPEIG